jgi:hypothetical protein
MKKKSTSQCASFSPRVLTALVFCLAGVFLAMLSLAATSSPWSLVTSPNPSVTQNNYLEDVKCTSTSDCWAVGFYYTGSVNQTLIERWNGTTWSVVASPNTSTSNDLYGVTCTSASDCWAVGYSQTGELFEHWDGTLWSIVTPSTSTPNNILYAVTCTSASDCWAVGYYWNGSVFQTLIEEWNGTSWSVVTSANTSATQTNVLLGVTCASASDCRAVGEVDNGTGGVPQTLIERWNGASWSIVSSPNNNTTNDNFLESVTCVSGSDCWAVGGYLNSSGVTQTLIEQWNGLSWNIVTSPNNGTLGNELYSINCASASECWAAGYYTNGSGVLQTLIEQWNGTSWGIVTSPNNGTSNNVLNAVTCASASECWAVGYRHNSSGVDQTLIAEYISPVQLNSAVSRMTHGSAGTFDITLPPTGPRGVECRSSALLGAGNYMMVFTFVNNVTNCGTASTTSGSAISNSIGPNSNQCTVNVTGVPNAQYLTVTLNNVIDSTNNNGNLSATVGVLIGDVTGNGIVSNGDVSAVQAQVAQTVTSSNFRDDVNANGTLSNGDASLTQAQVGQTLPSSP